MLFSAFKCVNLCKQIICHKHDGNRLLDTMFYVHMLNRSVSVNISHICGIKVDQISALTLIFIQVPVRIPGHDDEIMVMVCHVPVLFVRDNYS